jgi:hypothetical protein
MLAAGISGSIAAGGALGVTMFGPMAAGADSPASAPAVATQVWGPAEVAPETVTPDAVTGTATPGVDHSDNTPAHEATETPAREADETAGRAGGGHGGRGGGNHLSNKDPAHEAAESPARAAEEAARDAAIANGTTPTSTATG